MKQTFRATDIAVQPLYDTVSLASVDDAGKPRVSVQLWRDQDEIEGPKAVRIQLNGQSNVTDGRSIEEAVLGDDLLRLSFEATSALRGGEYEKPLGPVLRELHVLFSLDDERLRIGRSKQRPIVPLMLRCLETAPGRPMNPCIGTLSLPSFAPSWGRYEGRTPQIRETARPGPGFLGYPR